MADGGRAQCDACYEPATHLDYRVHPDQTRTDMRACKVHHDLAWEYKQVGRKVDETKKQQWLEKAVKPGAAERAQDLMFPDRDSQVRSRQLNSREKEIPRDALVQCDACHEPATHLDSRVHPDKSRTDVRACQPHNDLAEQYRMGRSRADESKKQQWLKRANKPEAPELADRLMSPDREDDQFRSRRLNNWEREINLGTLEPRGPSRGL